MRRLDGCINCQEVREMAAHGLCFKCYRAAERAEDKDTVLDRHTGAIQKERQRLFRAYSEVMVGLGKLSVNKHDVKAVIQILRPYLAPIAEMLRDSGTKPDRVNSEQKFERSPVNRKTGGVDVTPATGGSAGMSESRRNGEKGSQMSPTVTPKVRE
jgi:hypothetical protein